MAMQDLSMPSAMDGEPDAPDIDAAGVDRVQVRRLLALSPVERLRWLEELMEDIVELRRLNEKHSLR